MKGSRSIPRDLRSASRVHVPARPLGELLAEARAAPEGVQLWLADRWPWTPGTEAALSDRRPRWAITVIALDAVIDVAHLAPEPAVRELNRTHDPWPAASKRPSGA